jgi:signal transduction histidine kinase
LAANDFERKGIKIEALVHSEAKWGCADPRALQQVILNILTNASDVLEGRENPKIIIKISKMAGMLVVRITDNGCGISEEQQKHLFKPFYTNKAHGTGLGLVIAKKMMIKMNGTIEITSRKNEGTVIYIYIPEGKSEQF